MSDLHASSHLPLPTSLPDLDRLLDGGLAPHTTTAVVAARGVGVHELLLHQVTLSALQQGLRTVLVAAGTIAASRSAMHALALDSKAGDPQVLDLLHVCATDEAAVFADAHQPALVVFEHLVDVDDLPRGPWRSLVGLGVRAGTTSGRALGIESLAGDERLRDRCDTIVSLHCPEDHADLDDVERLSVRGEAHLRVIASRSLLGASTASLYLDADAGRLIDNLQIAQQWHRGSQEPFGDEGLADID